VRAISVKAWLERKLKPLVEKREEVEGGGKNALSFYKVRMKGQKDRGTTCSNQQQRENSVKGKNRTS